jgi:4-hydroxyphenylpyruvate dioxygenase
VQWADAPRLQMDLLNWSRHFRCMPGQGDFALAEFAAQLLRIGYDGYGALKSSTTAFARFRQQVARDGLRG